MTGKMFYIKPPPPTLCSCAGSYVLIPQHVRERAKGQGLNLPPGLLKVGQGDSELGW